MSLLQKTDTIAKPWKKLVIPAYILVSALILVYVGYSYIIGTIYNSGAQQGYQAAISELIKQTGGKCEPVAITLGETKVEVVNVACLKQAEGTQAQQTQQTSETSK